MSEVIAILGVIVIVVGILMVIVGSGLAVREQFDSRSQTKGLSETIDGLAKLADALAKHPVSLRIVFLGVLLIIVGGVLAGATALLSST